MYDAAQEYGVARIKVSQDAFLLLVSFCWQHRIHFSKQHLWCIELYFFLVHWILLKRKVRASPLLEYEAVDAMSTSCYSMAALTLIVALFCCPTECYIIILISSETTQPNTRQFIFIFLFYIHWRQSFSQLKVTDQIFPPLSIYLKSDISINCVNKKVQETWHNALNYRGNL